MPKRFRIYFRFERRRSPFSQARMIEVTEAGKVIYKTEHNALGRFPNRAIRNCGNCWLAPSRNFQVFGPLDFLAEVTQHVPDPGERADQQPVEWSKTCVGHERREDYPD